MRGVSLLQRHGPDQPGNRRMDGVGRGGHGRARLGGHRGRHRGHRIRASAILALVGHPLRADDQRLLTAFAAEVAAAYEQRRLADAARAVDVLTESERARTALLGAVSHDLRTPIASIKASVSSLRAADVQWTDAQRAELLATADAGLDRLTDLVTNLLDLSRLQAGVLPVLALPLGLDDVVASALHHLDAPPGAVDVDVPPTCPRSIADAGLLERVIANLVQNALRYSPVGVPVRVTASAARGHGRVAGHRPRPGHRRAGRRRGVRRHSSDAGTSRPTARASDSAWPSPADSPRRWAAPSRPTKHPAAARLSSSDCAPGRRPTRSRWRRDQGADRRGRPRPAAGARDEPHGRRYEVTEAVDGSGGLLAASHRVARRDPARPRAARPFRVRRDPRGACVQLGADRGVVRADRLQRQGDRARPRRG